jgi:ABC-type uncharacterized transport system substrate-binding protein
VSLGPDYSAMTRQAVAQVDKIIKGEKPGDIPVEQPQRYEIYINLKTARSLNVTISFIVARPGRPNYRIGQSSPSRFNRSSRSSAE